MMTNIYIIIYCNNNSGSSQKKMIRRRNQDQQNKDNKNNLKDKYKNAKIYKITNTVNGKIYIGSTHLNLEKRLNQHIYVAKKNPIYPLHKAMSELGQDKFKITLIENYPCCNQYELQKREYQLISEQPQENLYNVLKSLADRRDVYESKKTNDIYNKLEQYALAF